MVAELLVTAKSWCFLCHLSLAPWSVHKEMAKSWAHVKPAGQDTLFHHGRHPLRLTRSSYFCLIKLFLMRHVLFLTLQTEMELFVNALLIFFFVRMPCGCRIVSQVYSSPRHFSQKLLLNSVCSYCPLTLMLRMEDGLALI